jgi:sugar O-acyltransferase (sialic acid O-acetyltransferase NeuD family)
MALFGIFGAGGCGRGVLPIVRAMSSLEGEAVFIDDGRAGETINGARTLSLDEFGAMKNQNSICLAIADGPTRARLDLRCKALGIAFQTVQSELHVMMDEVTIGEGAIFSPFTIITSNVQIGRHFHLNIYSYVEHDCIIGDYVTFAPAVRCNGNVTIGDYAYIGSNAVIRQGITIGPGAVIGMGAVVTKDVPAAEVWAGNPARPLKANS